MEPTGDARLHGLQTSHFVTWEGETMAAHDTRLTVPERRLLAAMPLHAVTAIHGESGLRERLLIETGRLPDAQRAQIEVALALMSRLHEQDRRQREPYACHPLRVTIRILSHYRVTDQDVLCAALLHDTVEDHASDIAPGKTREAAFAVLAGQFGERTAGLVASVTNPPWEPCRDKHEQYREHVAKSIEDDPWARVIKVSDFTDNAAGLFHTTGPTLPRRASKYLPLLPVLRQFVLRTDTPLEDDVKRMIIAQLDKAERRLAAVICDDLDDM